MKSIILITLALAGLALTSCNTVAGAGQDIQRGGAAVTGAARDIAN